MTIDEALEALYKLKESGIKGDTMLVYGNATKKNNFKYEKLLCFREILIKDKPSLVQLVVI